MPAELANQIAAGEVVENPASCVKELVENAIDAGATEVKVDLVSGGMSLLSVRDNGFGLQKQDLSLAIERHATSKIRSFSDLESIASMGFRGEALASIASVSRFRMTSMHADSSHPWQLQCEASSTLETKLVVVTKPMPVGTVVEVRDLFFRVPARQKFLSKPRQEYQKARTIFKKLVLAHPSVSMSLTHDNKKVLDCPAAHTADQALQRITSCLGPQFAADQIYIDEKVAWGSVSGWCAKPLFTRRTQDMQFLFINQRPIQDRGLAFAVKRAYEDMLPPGCYPAFCLYLDMDPALVDVNVHPSKDKVRFAQADAIYQMVKVVVHASLRANAAPQSPPRHTVQSEYTYTSGAVTEVSPSTPTHDSIVSNCSGMAPDQAVATPSWHALSHVNSSGQGQDSVLSQGECLSTSDEGIHTQDDISHLASRTLSPTIDTNAAVLVANSLTSKQSADSTLAQTDLLQSRDKKACHLGFALAQLHGVYILSQTKDGLVMVDMHAAHERILYEKLKSAYRAQGIVTQSLLMPLACVLTEEMCDFALQQKAVLQQMGFSINPHSSTEIVITAYPSLLQKLQLPELLQSVLSMLHGYQDEGEIQRCLDQVFASMACHSAIRANRPLSKDEMQTLLRQIEATEGSDYCNHGRPVWFLWTMPTLDRIFHRGS